MGALPPIRRASLKSHSGKQLHFGKAFWPRITWMNWFYPHFSPLVHGNAIAPPFVQRVSSLKDFKQEIAPFPILRRE
jgi:hypothetical protein